MKWTDLEAPKSAMATLNRVSGITLWEEMIRDRRDFCLTKCQNNKVVNMLRPKCTDRRYLDVLLLKRETKKKMPLFCYSQRIKGLLRSFQEGETLLPDIYVYLDDYWKIIHEKQTKPLRNVLKRTLIKGKEVLPMGNVDQVLETHFLRDQIFILWPKLDLCLVNARETSIHGVRMFRSLVDTLSESYGFETHLEVQGTFVELKFLNLILADSISVETELEKSSAFTGFSESEIWAEIQIPSDFEEEDFEFKVKDLHLIFKTVLKVVKSDESISSDLKSENSVLSDENLVIGKPSSSKIEKK